MPFTETVETALGKTARKNMLPLHSGDVVETFADASLLRELTGYTPETSVETGVRAFVNWFRDYNAS